MTTPPANYAEAWQYMLEVLPMFTRVGPAALKPGLENIRAMCAALGNPENKFRSIHVAGTNGKGSTSHSLAAILQVAGYKTGLHTSPHLKHFAERVRVNGQAVEEQTIVRFIADNWALWPTVRPSFFEYSVLLAFHHFAKEQVDVAVIEVGLGGRLDSTNVITPELSVITNISFDHMDLLGNTLAAIAGEKAGIIKPNVPVVVGETTTETKPVFEAKAAMENAPISYAWQAITLKPGTTHGLWDVWWKGLPWFQNLFFSLTGEYQEHNLKTVLAAVQQLRSLGYAITDQHIMAGLANVQGLTGLKGRWQVLQSNPTVITDTGHNEAGLRSIAKQLAGLMDHHTDLWMVLGVVADKDVAKMLSLLPSNAHYVFCQAPIPRALPATDLADKARANGIEGEVIADVNEAIASVLSRAKPTDLVFVGGSTYTVAQIDRL